MKKPIVFSIFLIAIALLITLIAKQKNVNNDTETILNMDERRELSECIANMFWANLNNYYPYYDLDIVLAKLKELSKTPPRHMDPLECRMNYLLPLLEKINAYEAAKHLQQAEDFLKVISQKSGTIEIVKDKLYYEQLTPGEGPNVTLHDSPTLNFEESTLDHLNPCRTCENIKITLADTIKGFALGVNGMRVGEKRKIYVHPDLAYGKIGNHSPQQLMIYNVHLVDR